MFPVLTRSGLRPTALWIFLSLLPLAFCSLWSVSSHNYLLFHSLVEILGVGVAFTIFSIGWNGRLFCRNNAMLLLAVAYLPIGILDLLHALSYAGMGVFPSAGANLPTQLWVAGRYLETASLVAAAALLPHRSPLPTFRIVALYLVAFSGLTIMIFTGIFPECYITGVGLTPFKIGSEYLFVLLLAAAALLFWRNRKHLTRDVLFLLIASAAVTALSELSFTLYLDVFGFFNFLGHAFKILSVLLIYAALVRGALQFPYNLLFQQLSDELTERREAETRLRDINRELDAFVSTASHDLRSPLVPIIGYAQYLQETEESPSGEEVRSIASAIESQGRLMLATMEDLLALSRVGRLDNPEHPVPVGEVVDSVLLNLNYGSMGERSKILKGDLPPVKIPRTLLMQIFDNLIGNALRYAGQDGSPIRVEGERHGNRVLYYVKDRGPGVAEEERERIFAPFHRGTAGEGRPGTGIGLATVRKVASLYDGRAWVEETPGGGATFGVELRDEAGGA